MNRIFSSWMPVFFLGVFSLLVPLKAWSQPDIKQGEQLYINGDVSRGIVACASCHGSEGNSSIVQNPKLGGQHSFYTEKQLLDFQSGKRAATVMSAMVAQMTPEEMKNIAAYLAAQQPVSSAAKNQATLNLGEKIYRAGFPDLHIAACASCHAPNGAGIPNQYPRLGGQHAEYTAAELKKFRDGSRKNGPMMATIAHRLSDHEIAAVADYIAGLASPLMKK